MFVDKYSLSFKEKETLSLEIAWKSDLLVVHGREVVVGLAQHNLII